MASGAAALSAQLLSESRGTLVTEKEYPPERDISGEPPRVGVFICRCGTNIARGVDVPKVVRYAKSLDDVVHAEESVFACSIDATTHLGEVMKEQGLNRAVVAACTPRTHEPVFQETLREVGLNPYLFEMANIREQCSFVHAKDKAAATKKAQDAVRMAVAKARLLKPLQQLSMGVNRNALVIGGGTSGMVSALSLAEQGFEVHLVEKTEALGGTARRIYHILEGGDIQTYVQELITKVNKNPLVQVYTEANIVEASGYVGNFITTVNVGVENVIKEISHGVTIIATGAEEFKPTEYFYGKNPRVLTLLELETEIVTGGDRITQCNTLVIIECVGSRDSERPYCSRVCCGQAVKNALKLKEMNPEMEIYVLYRDMRTYAFKEDYYQKAAEQEVKFIRYELDDKPEVEVIQENGQELLRVSITEPILGQRLVIDADALALGTGIVAPIDNKELSQLFKVPLNEDGFFLEAHMKLRPVDFATEGIFMCGLAHSPKCIDESSAQAQAAASRAATVLVKDFVAAEGIICSVNEKICSGCGVCELVCPYKAIQVDSDKRVAKVNEALCKGCGSCCSACLAGVINMNHFEDEQILAQIEALTG
jgi:heterodisulfide reductase subunit A